MDYLHYLLVGSEAVEHLLPDGALAYPSNELLDYLIVNVCLEQGSPHLAHGLGDVPFPNLSLPAQLFENARELIAQILKQRNPSPARKISKLT